MREDHLASLQTISTTHVPKVDFHMHTRWTDGAHSTGEMVEAAVVQGLTTVLLSDHARKTSEEWFGKFAEEVRAIPLRGCRALVGLETRIADLDGSIDSTEHMISQCDMVLASVHRFPDGKGGLLAFDTVDRTQAEDLEFRLAMAALDNPRVDVLAHPFGMCFRRYGITPSEEHICMLIAKAAQTGVAIEINAYYHRDPWTLIQWCQQAGARISLGSDAHHRDEVGNIINMLEGRPVVWTRSESS